jgi:hypothetical protein
MIPQLHQVPSDVALFLVPLLQSCRWYVDLEVLAKCMRVSVHADDTRQPHRINIGDASGPSSYRSVTCAAAAAAAAAATAATAATADAATAACTYAGYGGGGGGGAGVGVGDGGARAVTGGVTSTSSLSGGARAHAVAGGGGGDGSDSGDCGTSSCGSCGSCTLRMIITTKIICWRASAVNPLLASCLPTNQLGKTHTCMYEIVR